MVVVMISNKLDTEQFTITVQLATHTSLRSLGHKKDSVSQKYDNVCKSNNQCDLAFKN